jgi:hypothetical protein
MQSLEGVPEAFMTEAIAACTYVPDGIGRHRAARFVEAARCRRHTRVHDYARSLARLIFRVSVRTGGWFVRLQATRRVG